MINVLIPLQFILFQPETHCVLVLRTHPVGAVVSSPSMIADVQANREMLSLYPDRVNPGALWASARALKPEEGKTACTL